MNKIVIILAGGLGKRMESDLPKVCHKFKSIPMIVRVITESLKTNPIKIFIVVGKYKNVIKETLYRYNILENYSYEFVIQNEALGTGHAVLCTREKLLNFKNINTVILCGDIPLIDNILISKIASNVNDIKCLTTEYNDPKTYGRIIRKNGYFEKITEFNDCNEDEKKIKEVNCGIYCINSNLLIKYLPMINNNNKQNEYYLTDIIELIKQNENINIDTLILPEDKQYLVEGINSKDELILLEKKTINLKV